MTTLPISMPYVFANVTTTQRLAYLDADFATLTNTINGIGNGSVALANVNITGGNVAASANSVPLSVLQATGTLTAQHYLRGDGTWSGIASPAGGTVTSINVNGGSTGFTFTGGPVDVSGNITMSGSYTGNIDISQISNYGTVGNVLTSNGSAWISQAISTGGQFQNQLFVSSGTWTAPAGVTKVRAYVVGGGGGCDNNALSNQGGYGGVAVGFYTVTPGTTYTVTVGSGGNGSNGNGGATNGGTSSFSSFISATGGVAGNGGGGGGSGTGVNGNIRNYTSIASVAGLYFFVGNGNTLATSTTPVVWNINAASSPGGSSTNILGGTGGIVFLEWVG